MIDLYALSLELKISMVSLIQKGGYDPAVRLLKYYFDLDGVF